MKAEVYPSPDGWRFRIKGNNGEIIALGESYVRRIDAESALRTLFTNRAVDVTVRGHSTEVVDHYTIGKWRRDTADPSGLTEEEKKLHYEPYDPERNYDVLRKEIVDKISDTEHGQLPLWEEGDDEADNL